MPTYLSDHLMALDTNNEEWRVRIKDSTLSMKHRDSVPHDGKYQHVAIFFVKSNY